MSETPVFLTPEFAAEVAGAAREIVAQLRTPEFYATRPLTAIPAGLEVPHETPHPLFLQVDFGICADPARMRDGSRPRLIELQGFPEPLRVPAVFVEMPARRRFQRCLADGLAAVFFRAGRPIELRRAVCAGLSSARHDPENVILLEIEPEPAKDAIDFACTETLLGVRAVDVSAVIKRGRQLYYLRDGREVPNRAHLQPAHLRRIAAPAGSATRRSVCRTTWKWSGPGHPNWYFRMSKHSLPFLEDAALLTRVFCGRVSSSDERSVRLRAQAACTHSPGLGVDVEPTRSKLAALAEVRTTGSCRGR